MKIIFMILALIFTMCASAFAEDTANANVLGIAVQGVVYNTILPLIVALIGSIVSIVLLKLKSRLNIQLAAETETWIQGQAESAIQMVAEKAAARIKYDKIVLTKNQKLDMAIGSLISKVPNISREQADAYIHAAIARIPGVGSTGDKALVAG